MLDVTTLADQNLLTQLDKAARMERQCQAAALIFLAEIEKRRLHLRLGFKNMFEFCVERFGWSEGSVYRRTAVARKGVQHPELLSAIREQKLSLTVASLIAPHLEKGNAAEFIAKFHGKTRRETEDLLTQDQSAEKKRAESIRLIGTATTQSDESEKLQPLFERNSAQQTAPTPEQRTDMKEQPAQEQKPNPPVAEVKEEIYSFKFTGKRSLRDKVSRAKEVMASKLDRTDLDKVLEAALDCLLDNHDPKRREARMTKRDATRLAKQSEEQLAVQNEKPNGTLDLHTHPAAASTQDTGYIAEFERRLALKHAGHRCEWTVNGKRCTATANLQIDHIISYSKGGPSAGWNLQVLCRSHNLLKARLEFGDAKIDSETAKRRQRVPSPLFG